MKLGDKVRFEFAGSILTGKIVEKYEEKSLTKTEKKVLISDGKYKYPISENECTKI